MPDADYVITALTHGWAGEIERLIEIYDPECRFVDRAFNIEHLGHEGIREVHAFSFSMMPDFSVKYGLSAFQVDNGAVEWVFTGTFTGSFEGATLEGRSVSINGISFMTFRGGRIHTNTDYWNLDDLRRQLSS